MESRFTVDTEISGKQNTVKDQDPRNGLQERLLALELQLKIFKQAETIGEIGNWQINLNTYETWYSENVFRIYGLEPYTVTSHPDTFTGLLHEDDREIVLNTFEKSYSEKIPLHLEFRIKRMDGEVRYLNIVSTVTKNPLGEPLLTGISQDITDRKKLEIQLREFSEEIKVQNESFKHAEQIGSFGTWQVNLNTRQTSYSENFYRLFGLKPTSLFPGLEEFGNFVHPDDQALFKKSIQSILEEQTPPDSEFRIIRTDGRTRVFTMKGKALKNAEGDPLIVGVIKDITPSVKLENQLKATNEKLLVQNEAFIQAEKTTNIGSWTWKLNTNDVQFSDNIYYLFGLRPQSEKVDFDMIERYYHPMDKPGLVRMRESMKENPTEVDIKYRIVRKDGKTRHMRTRSIPITAPDGNMIIIGTTQDISEDVHLNQRLNERMHFAEMLSENIVDKVCITNTSNIIIGWNNRSELGFDLTKQDVLGRNIFEVLPKLKSPEMIDRYKRVLNGETIHVPLLEIFYLPGYYELTMVPIKTGEDIIAVLSILHDITAFQRLKGELEERIEFIEKLVESSVDRIMVFDRDMKILYWNKRCEEYHQLSKDQVVGKNIFDVFANFRHDTVFESIKKAWRGETPYLPANKDSVEANYSDSYFVPIKNTAQHVVALLWIAHDLTDQVRAEKDLKQNRDLLQSVFDTSMIGIAVFETVRNEEDTIVDFECKLVNKFSQKIFDRDFTGEKQSEILSELDQDFFEISKQVVETSIPVDMEKHFSGNAVSGWFRITAAKMGDGLVIGFNNISDQKESEEQLIRQRALLLDAEEIAKLGSWEFNPETNIFTWSDQLYRIYDYTPQTFVPTFQFFLDTIVPEDRHLVENAFEYAPDHKRFSIRHRLRTLDGRVLVVILKGAYIRKPDESTDTIIGTIQDVTEQFEIEDELRKKNDTIRLQGHMDRQVEKLRKSGSWQWDVNSGTLTWGESMFHLFGLSPYSIEPNMETFFTLVHPTDRKRVESFTAQVVDAKDEIIPPIEFRILVKEEVRYLRLICKKITNVVGTYVIGSAADITEDTILRERLAERMNFVEALIDSSVDRIMAFDKELKVLVWNKKCEETYGHKKEDVIGRPFLEIFPNVAENETVMAAFQTALGGSPVHIPVQPAYYTTGYIEGHYIPLRMEETESYGVLNILHDVTERIESEKELRNLNVSLAERYQELQNMNEELNSFAFIASHDLREPLRKVQVFTDRLLQNEVPNITDKGRYEFMRIKAAVARMDELIDDILSFSSINSSERHFHEFELEDVLQLVKTDMQELIEETKAVIEHTPLPTMLGNPSHFSHLFLNLLSNAIKYQPTGQAPLIKIEASIKEGKEIQHSKALADASYLEICVTDNGIGFEQEYEHRIYQMFQRLHGMHEYSGTGMGLAICKKVVDAYQGFITATSSPGKGARFSCYFKRTSSSSNSGDGK